MCYCETPDKESSSVDKCYKIDGGILETEQKRYASFRRVRGLGHTTVSELLMAIQEKVLFDTFSHFPNKVVHIVALTPTTERSFGALRRLKVTSAAPWSNKVSVTASHLLTLKGHMPTL